VAVVNRWIPALVAGLAIPTFVAFWIGGDPRAGMIWGGLSVVFGIVLALGGRSDTIRLLRGEDDDERSLALERQATMLTGIVLIVALAVLFLVTATHLGALALLNRRS
jgi:hypothetical protein